MMKPLYYSKLLPEMAARSKYATVSRLGFSNTALRSYLLDKFSVSFGQDGSFLGNPVFEATFGWKTATEKMRDLAGSLLSPALVDAMDSPPKELRADYRFPKDATPYVHQLQSWRLLASPTPQSVVVTSGTGSGKTECFMVPILDQLCREYHGTRQPLVGVRALFLYPLNALINSQRDRLHAWTHAFNENVRFCLYNGNTPDKVPERERAQVPNQVLDRETLRKAPPPILVTNATMLEYMLVRAQDAPILDKSKGRLEWIVLDEAHSYIGSQAAELALLLRRLLYGFGVKAGQVRFVATSATIGDPAGEAGKKLQAFLADLAGIALDQVHVVGGQRSVPALPEGDGRHKQSSLDVLQSLQSTAVEADSKDQLFAALSANEMALKFRNRFVKSSDGKPVALFSELCALLPSPATGSQTSQQTTALQWLDLLTATTRKLPSGRTEPFLPLRAHLYHQVMPGLWACSDPHCQHRSGTKLDTAEWPYGKVYLEERKRCECGAPVFEIHTCNECNETFLSASLVFKETNYFLQVNEDDAVDEFSLDVENTDEEQDDSEPDPLGITHRTKILIANRNLDDASSVRIDRDTLQLEPHHTDNCLRLDIRDQEELKDGRTALCCPNCQMADSTKMPLSRRAILGAPFLLGQIIPTLLEFCEDGEQPLNKPYRGKRMITFTDSRQGTARIAAKIQQESERNRMRGLVLARVSKAVAPVDTPAIQEKRRHIAMMREMLAKAPNIGLEEVVRGMEKEIASASDMKPVLFNEMADYLTTNEPDIKRMYDFYQAMDPDIFGGAGGSREFAKMVLAREFARRPRRVNSCETMGLVAVQYPKLAAVQTAPAVGGMTLDEWKAFLKIALDFFVRENTCIDLPASWMKWGGNKIPRKYLLGPLYKDAAGKSYLKWPQVSGAQRNHRLVRLLSYGLKIDPRTAEGRDVLDVLLRRAWDDLISASILQGSLSGGYFLTFDAMAFAPITRAWVCPVTRRILDVTFKGVTPYLPREEPTPATAQCREILLPACALLSQSFTSETERLEAIREWLAATAEITTFREEGLWSDLSDRVMEGGAYFRAAEHSAQQPASRLGAYERQFKEGYLNLLSCSTTMEMGVDIGGISVVAMNNVPPHPANYLQRAGRAGRRSETRAVALTVCKNNPHDQAVFDHTRWPFDTSLPLPGISLSSSAIVQRHLNSMLLSHFLRTRTGTAGVDLNKLDCAWFFLPQEQAHADQFCHWAENFLETAEPILTEGLRSLIRNTCFDGAVRLSGLVQASANEMRRVRDKWYGEYAGIVSRIAEFSTVASQKEPACKALTIQRNRLASEYLLSELATEGFLPGYGFPTHIASFDTLNIEEIKRNKQQTAHREDNRMRRRDLASRDLITALREYAPGSDVVMDGMVYRSAGITLNWHAPAALQEVREIQNIRIAWRCRSCGASGTEPNIDSALHCAECGKPISPEGIRKYLEPAGFAVDLYADIHNDVSQQQFIKPQLPWIHVQADWAALPNARLGRFRTSADGTAYFHSSGVHDRGYAICLKCGRAEPMEDETSNTTLAKGHLPSIFRYPHKPLRGKQGGEGALCSGSDEPWSIMTKLHLGHEVRTDVLELQLKSIEGAYLQDETVAFSLAVAIRSAIADTLGVQDEELGCSTKEVRVDGNAICRSILVYDNNASGYVSAVSDRIDAVLRKAAEKLHCPKKCDSACQHCLDGYGTRFQSDSLNRHAALAFLNNAWIRDLHLPVELAFFGPEQSKAEYQPLPEAIWRELTRPTSQALQIYLHGRVEEWDLPASALRSYLYRWIGKEKPITLVLTESAIQRLSVENKQMLGAWACLEPVKVAMCKDLPAAGRGILLAQVISTGGTIAWATDNPTLGRPDLCWGTGQGQTLVRGHAALPAPVTMLPVSASELMISPTQANSYRYEIAAQLNGCLQGFGDRFWREIFNTYPELAAPLERSNNSITKISYRDRYLNAPLPVGLVLEAINGLKRRFADLWEPKKILIETAPLATALPGAPTPRFVWSDWLDESARQAAVEAAFGYCGLDRIEFSLVKKHDAEHARTLDISFQDGSGLIIRFDQGLSYWKANRPTFTGSGQRFYENEFDFSSVPQEQGEKIAELRTSLVNPNYPTFLYVNLR
jgi:DEAD/DEAH box helicase domain-containing protein